MRREALKRFSDAVLALQGVRGLDDFAPSCLAAMQFLLDADYHVINWLGESRIATIEAMEPQFPREARMEAANAHISEHPLYRQICAYEPNLLDLGRWSDITTVRSLRQTALYHDFFRVVGVTRQMALTFCVPTGGTLAIVYNRSRRDFSDEERDFLRLFGPHVSAAFLQVLAQEELKEALALQRLAARGQAVFITDLQGDLLFATDEAWTLTQEYFPGSPARTLPSVLRDPPPGLTARERAFDHPRLSRRLVCLYGSPARLPRAAAERLMDGASDGRTVRLLRLKEENPFAEPIALQDLGLTSRDAEVLHWIAQGKRNEEIAIILSIRQGTVKKHCENIFAKLGVENRGSAAAAAMDCLRSGLAP